MGPAGRVFLGIDVGAAAAYVVRLEADGRIAWGGAVFPGDELTALLEGDAAVAIDAPDQLSRGPHLQDSDPVIRGKFRSARCAEVALMRAHYPVPWTTPVSGDAAASWMKHGFEIWAAFRRAGIEPIEVYPHATFHRLAGKLPAKGTLSGRLARADILHRAGVSGHALPLWGHDGLDAASAALVALLAHRGQAHPVLCEDQASAGDGSAIWLPDGGA